jgi:predicted Zn-dependent peptidase
MQQSRLDNGIRVLSEEIPHVQSVAVGIWVENGSRYEEAARNGISHYIEHLLFKGTERRTAAEIAEEIDAVGGVLNAFTGKEYTCYYAKVLSEHLPLAFDLLADIFLNSRFPPDEIERERGVILQEIAQVADTPDEHIHDLFKLHFWRDHPLAWPICGTTETVSQLTREDLLEFMAARYRPDQIIVAAAGDLRHDAFVARAAAAFAGVTGRVAPSDGAPPRSHRGLAVHERGLEQVHICFGVPAVAQVDPRRYAASVLDIALGGGMSSRLFQEVRERRGRAYTIHSFLASYRDAGYLGVYAATNRDWVAEVVEVIVAEMRRLGRTGLMPGELARAKNQLKGNLLLGLETTNSRMSRLATNEIYYGREVPVEEVAREIDAVTNDGVTELAARWLASDAVALTLLGDLKNQRIDEGLLPSP